VIEVAAEDGEDVFAEEDPDGVEPLDVALVWPVVAGVVPVLVVVAAVADAPLVATTVEGEELPVEFRQLVLPPD
jgi:hypothetical protein